MLAFYSAVSAFWWFLQRKLTLCYFSNGIFSVVFRFLSLLTCFFICVHCCCCAQLRKSNHYDFHIYVCFNLSEPGKEIEEFAAHIHEYSMNLRYQLRREKKRHWSNEANLLKSAKVFAFFPAFEFKPHRGKKSLTLFKFKVKWALKQKVRNQTPEFNFLILFRRIKSIILEKRTIQHNNIISRSLFFSLYLRNWVIWLRWLSS